MNSIKFKLAKEYQGYWNIPTLGENIPGTLHIDKHLIHLELHLEERVMIRKMNIEKASGHAFTKEPPIKGYSFYLYELSCTSASCSTYGQSIFSFEIASLSITDSEKLNIDNINNICIRSQLLDRWITDYIIDCYDFDPFPVGTNQIRVTFAPPKESIDLYQSEKMEIYIYLGYDWSTPSCSGFNLNTRSFLNIQLKEPITFDNAFELSEHMAMLLSLLWNNNICPEFVKFRCDESTFIYKQSDKYSYKYHDRDSTFIATYHDDFPNEDLQTIIGNWMELLSNNANSIDTLFEAIFNEHMPLTSSIKNYITVIDSLTEKIPVESDGQLKKGKAKMKFNQILSKIETNLDTIGISKDELNLLKNGVLRQTTKDLSLRISSMLDILSEYVTIKLESDFCKKAINTRNYITHSRTRTDNMYLKTQYWSLSHCLRKLALSYVLYTIGVKPETARKIVGVISMDIE